MKRKLALLILLIPACAGVKARDVALLPIAQRVWTSVRENVERGVADGALSNPDPVIALADRLTAALNSGDRSGVASVNWKILELFAVRGVRDMVDDGEISEGVAAVLLQRIANLRDVLRELGFRLSHNTKKRR